MRDRLHSQNYLQFTLLVPGMNHGMNFQFQSTLKLLLDADYNNFEQSVNLSF